MIATAPVMVQVFRHILLLALLLAASAYADTPASGRSERGSSIVQGGGSPPAGITAVTRPVVSVDVGRALGSPTAKVVVIEFADYQCPYCRGFHVGALPKIYEAYIKTGKVRYFYKEYPLPNHSQAFNASVAAQCAGAQGRYWEMQDLLYTEQARLGAELYDELAIELKLDLNRYKVCLTSSAPRRTINKDIAEGKRLPVTGTPTFVLGRMEREGVVTVERMSTGAPAFEVFARELDALLK